MRRRFRLGLALLGVIGGVYLWLAFASRTPPADLPARPLPDSVAALAPEGLAPPPGFRTGIAGFSLWQGEVEMPYERALLAVQPGETATMEARGALPPLSATASAGIVSAAEGKVGWQAPTVPGPYELRIEDARGARIAVTALVWEPFDARQTRLNGYEIGHYPSTTYRGNPRYAPPEGLIPVRGPQDHALPVSPHFTLGAFLAKQASGYPKYLLLDERLLVKLELLLERVRAAGFDVETLFVMSGYRTPFYNASIGNETTYSAHVFGLAADVFVDADGDGMMDDLDGDGQITVEDARVLWRLAEPLDTLYGGALAGGLGLYAPAPHRGPFIHVDVRGTPVRW